MKYFSILMLSVVLLPATAGLKFTADQTVTGDGIDTQKTSVTVYVEGDNARIEFDVSNNPTAGSGTYVVTKDAGKTMLLVNPEEKTYMTWDMSQLMTFMGNNGMVKMEFANTDVKKLEESDGGKVMGKSTRRYKFRTSYDLNMKIMGMRQNQSVESEQESWTTTAYKDPGMGVWLRNMPTTGIEGLDTLIEESMKAVKGFPLKTKTKTITKQYNRKRTKVKRTMTSYNEMEVKEIVKTKVDASMFEPPADYQKVDLGEASGLGGLKNIFKKQ